MINSILTWYVIFTQIILTGLTVIMGIVAIRNPKEQRKVHPAVWFCLMPSCAYTAFQLICYIYLGAK